MRNRIVIQGVGMTPTEGGWFLDGGRFVQAIAGSEGTAAADTSAAGGQQALALEGQAAGAVEPPPIDPPPTPPPVRPAATAATKAAPKAEAKKARPVGRVSEEAPDLEIPAEVEALVLAKHGIGSADEIEAFRAHKKAVEESKLSGKAKDELRKKLDRAESGITSSVKFVADQFSEHVETVTEHAKIEVGAYVTNAIARAGVAALEGKSLLLLDVAPEEKP